MARTKNPKVPRLVAGVDVTTLPLSPLEGFVMSRIDGEAPVHLLADLTSLDEAEVARIVARLIELGAAEWVRESVSLLRASVLPPARTPSAPFDVPSALRERRADLGSADTLRAMPAAADSGPPSPDPASSEPASPAPASSEPTSPKPASSERASSELALSEPTSSEPVSPEPASSEPTSPKPASSEPASSEPASPEVALSEPTSPKPASSEFATSEPASPEPTSPKPASSEPASSEPFASEPPASDSPASEPRASEPGADADELDLDPERRTKIDDLHAALDWLDHYRLLGVERDAPRAEVRDAYFRLSKVFHPDTMFRKRLGPYKAKMEAVFSRLTEAYEVLGKKRARQEYDRYLALQDQTREVEDVLERAAEPAEVESADVARDDVAPEDLAPEDLAPEDLAPEDLAPEDLAPPRRPDPETIARRRALRAQSLRRAAGASAAARGREAVQPSEPASPDRAEVLRRLASSLKSSASHTGGLDPAERHVERARRAEKAGELAEAARELRVAVSLAPERADLQAEHARVDARLLSSLSHTYEEQALYEQRHGKWAAAAISWRKVFAGRPDDARAAREAARALIEAEGDLHRARQLAQRAVELSPDDGLNLQVLGRVYLAAGLRLNARRVLERAAALDPGDEMVETLLRSLGRD